LVALSKAPETILKLSANLKANRNLENVLPEIDGNDMFSCELKKIYWNTWNGKNKNILSTIKKLSIRCSKYSKGLSQSMDMIIESFHQKNNKKREECLDKAVEIVISGSIHDMNKYSKSIYMPTILLFSFGLVVPLMMMSILPIVYFFSIGMNEFFIGVCLLITLIVTLLFSEKIIKEMPIAFSFHHKTNRNFWLATIIAVMVSVPGIFYFLGEMGVVFSDPIDKIGFSAMPIVWGVVIGVIIYFYYSIEERKKIIKMNFIENEFIDSLYIIKNRLNENIPLEKVFEMVSSDAGIGEIYRKIFIRSKIMSLEKAIGSVMHNINSEIITSSLKLVYDAYRNGSMVAGKTAETIHDYRIKIKIAHANMREMFSKYTSMIKISTMFFAPIICATSVMLFSLVSGMTEKMFGEMFQISVPSSEMLQLILGLYLVGLNVVMIKFAGRIEYGFDEVMTDYELLKAIPVSIFVFSVSVFLLRIVFVV
jgi:hypothetical protein